MISLKRTGRGFTIVELLIVIVVIGILAALVIVTYSGIQKRARDTERKTDVKGIQGQLEAYWADSAKYPTLTEANDASAGGFRDTNFKGLPGEAFADPKDATSQQLCASTASDCYGYAVTPALCDNSATSCDNYTLTATLESGGTFPL
jgi:prepilin-type N-terminal cleavage/methylation domain-containing protein